MIAYISQFSYTDVIMNMKLLAAVSQPSIYHDLHYVDAKIPIKVMRKIVDSCGTSERRSRLDTLVSV